MFNAAGTTGANNSYYPKNLDVVAIEGADGGFVGGTKGLKTHPVLVEACKEWEHYVVEISGDKFGLKQKVSGLHLGGTENAGEVPFLTQGKAAWELFQYNVLPNGLINITNHKGNKLSREGKKIHWSDKNTLNESWKFKLVESATNTTAHNQAVNTSALTKANPPPNGALIGLQNVVGGWVGGYKNENSEVQIVPKMQDWEKYTVEDRGNQTFALKQKVSGFYLGHTAGVNERVKLAGKIGDNEVFALEGKGNGQFAIRNSKNHYLSRKDQAVQWTNQVQGPADLWRIDLDPSMNINWDPQAASVSVSASHNTTATTATNLPVNGHTYGIATAKGDGWIGTVKGLHQDVKIAKKLQEWEHFVYTTKDNRFSLKQGVSGFNLGYRKGQGEHVGLTDCVQDYELFTLVPRGNAFAIKNGYGMYLSHQGDNVVWNNTVGDAELWKFEAIPNK
jgi:hypothetical protein